MQRRRVAEWLALGAVLTVLAASFLYFRVQFLADYPARARALVGRPTSDAKSALGEPREVMSSASYLGRERARIKARYEPEPPDTDCETVWVYEEDLWLVLLFVTSERVVLVYCGSSTSQTSTRTRRRSVAVQ